MNGTQVAGQPQVVVIGAGAAGLATAACLLRRGIRPLVLDRGDVVGQTWAGRYDRLHLHTPRIQSHLPGYKLPARAGRWVSRDDVVRYLRAYALHHRIDVTFGATVSAVRQVDGRWHVTGDGVDITAPYVVLATGLNCSPVMPSWPGVDSFTGTISHAATYRNATPYRGRDVLVVGSGNSGAEIAADLAESGAAHVYLSVRTSPHVIPRQVGPLPTTLLGILQSFLPPAVVDPVNRRISRTTVGDLTPYGLPAPDEGLSARMRRTGVVPTIDVGTVAQLRAGRIEVVPAVSSFEGAEVHLADGRALRPHAVIAATGYRDGASDLLSTGSAEGLTLTDVVTGHRRPHGLYAVGMTQSQRGLLFQINLDARRVARAIARDPQTSGSPRRR